MMGGRNSVPTQTWQRPVATCVCKPDAANAVWSSWWWAVETQFPLRLDNGRSPHVYVNQTLQMQFWATDDGRYAARNMLSFTVNVGIINSIAGLHLVGYFYWFILRCTDPWIINLLVNCWSRCRSLTPTGSCFVSIQDTLISSSVVSLLNAPPRAVSFVLRCSRPAYQNCFEWQFVIYMYIVNLNSAGPSRAV
jgi:hypothetical protein